MHSRLDMFQIGNDGKGHNDQQGPGTPFPHMDCRPCTKLIGIFPDAEEGTDIFGQPDKEPDQHKGALLINSSTKQQFPSGFSWLSSVAAGQAFLVL